MVFSNVSWYDGLTVCEYDLHNLQHELIPNIKSQLEKKTQKH